MPTSSVGKRSSGAANLGCSRLSSRLVGLVRQPQSRLKAGCRQNCLPHTRAGVTLIEMLVVLLIIALIVGLTFPAMTAGIETLRLNGAARGIAAFINRGLNRSERRQQVVQV